MSVWTCCKLAALPSPLWGGAGGGGRCWSTRLAPQQRPPSPSRLRPCPLPAIIRVTKPRQAGGLVGEGADRVRRSSFPQSEGADRVRGQNSDSRQAAIRQGHGHLDARLCLRAQCC